MAQPIMVDLPNPESFEEIVEWAYNTLPQKIRDLPDFPGIQVLEEPPEEVLKEVAKRRNWPKGTAMLGLYSGFHRTEPQHFQTRIAPDLIFVFRGPILRYSKGNLRAEVKQVVWHEVAHWLGHNEEEVRELGLSRSSLGWEDATHEPDERRELKMPASQAPIATVNDENTANEQPRCIRCYSPDITCHNIEKPLSYPGMNLLSNPITIHARSCKCSSCGYEWDDEG